MAESSIRDFVAPLRNLAGRGIFIGTSSWKYEGWVGQLYDRERFVFRGKFAKSRFDRDCVTEYARFFKTVCVDAAYYQFPSVTYLAGLFEQVPHDFRFTFKVTDDVTIKRFPNVERSGMRAGQTNPDFLNAQKFIDLFLRPCAPFKERIGMLVFEFSRFHSTEYKTGGEFVADLDAFLGKLPKGWSLGTEIRNQEFLCPGYFACLRKHGVAHVFNSWTHMPPVQEQMAIAGSQTSDAFVGARFLLRPGRTYEKAVKEFFPYRETKDPFKEARDAALSLILLALAANKKALIYINNRLEGNALATVRALVEALAEVAGPPVAETQPSAPPAGNTMPNLPGF